MKRVLFVAPPFRGHLHPVLGLARAAASDHRVWVASTPGGVAVAAAAGLAGREILAEHEIRVWEIAEPGRGVRGNPVRLFRQLAGNVALMERMKNEIDELLDELRPDLLVVDFTVPVAGLAATQREIPWWTTLPSPCVLESPDGPPAYFGGQGPARGTLDDIRHALMRRSTRAFKRLMGRVFRGPFARMGFRSVYRADGSEAVYSPHRILALGYREIEFPRTYPKHLHFVGPVLYTPPDAGPSREDGLPAVRPGDGSPRVLVTLGTHLPQDKASAAAAVREIARRHPGIVFHFTHGRADAPAGTAEGNFREFAYLGYDTVPGYDLVVHHAGAGILNQCLRHGVPAVVHPRDFDQFDNAARLVHHRLARPVRRLGEWEEAILAALSDTELRRSCRDFADLAASYDAPGTVGRWIREGLYRGGKGEETPGDPIQPG